ncbi:hypothetical protein [Burkholderia sp. Bp9031]|uniref:hypothetical protein n=1 Tax=Burkholderia sp. Bp9031 TaxID=2184566 RepID=UPI0026CF2E06
MTSGAAPAGKILHADPHARVAAAGFPSVDWYVDRRVAPFDDAFSAEIIAIRRA